MTYVLHYAPDYLALNPNGLIPVLETPDGVMFETGAILLWLADRHGALAPAPTDSARADFLKWLFFTSNTLHAALRQLFYPWKVVGPSKADQSVLRAGLQNLLQTHFATLDQHWAAPHAPDAISLYVAACLRWSQLYGPEDHSWFDLDAYPKLKHMAAALEGRPSVRASMSAEGWSDAPFTKPVPANPSLGSAI
jgi:glutathione S-transferase